MNQEKLKKVAGYASVKYITDGMVLALGTGSTVHYLLEALAKRIEEEDLNITAVSSSKKTLKEAKDYGIKIQKLEDVKGIDLCIDGVDEVNPNFDAIKGGGGALLYEKIIASYSAKNIWIADQSKLVDKLGKFPLATEVVPYGSEHLFSELEDLGYKPSFRMKDNEKYVTDSGNYIIDLHLGEIDSPRQLSVKLNNIPGIVENGLFYDVVDLLIVGTAEGPREFRN